MGRSEKSEKEGLQLMEQAERRLKGRRSFLSSIFSGGRNKTEDAIECYQRAASRFKTANKWSNAGGAFAKAADLQIQNQNGLSAAINLIDAANCYTKTDIKEAVACFEKAIEKYLEMGKFYYAAKQHEAIAEALEADGNANMEKVIYHYEKAVELYKVEDSNAAAHNVMLKVAVFAAKMEDYTKAIKLYEAVADSCLESGLLTYSAKESFFWAAVCHLCVGVLNCQQALERYVDTYPGFQDSREYKLMKNLTFHVKNKDVDAFTVTLEHYASITTLDNWLTTLFLRVKKTINADGELR